METPPRFPGKLLMVCLGCTIVFVTLLYGHAAVTIGTGYPLRGTFWLLAYGGLMVVLLPLVRQAYKSKGVIKQLERSFDENAFRAHLETLRAEARYEHRTKPIVITNEDLRYMWTPRAFLQHRRGRETLRFAGLLSLSHVFIVLDAILYDSAAIVMRLLILISTMLIIGVLGVMFFREEVMQDYVDRRLREERPWLFDS